MSVTSKPCLEILPAENGFILRPSHDPNSSPRRDGGYHVFETFDSMVGHLRKVFGEEASAVAKGVMSQEESEAWDRAFRAAKEARAARVKGHS